MKIDGGYTRDAQDLVVKEGKMRMSILFTVLLATALGLSACGTAEPLITTVILPTVIRETQVVEVTRVVTQVIVLTVEVPVPVPVTAGPPVVTEAPALAPPTAVPPPPIPPIIPLVNVEPWGSMLVPRSMHTATLLLDGRILVVGGSKAGDSQLSEVEIVDPISGTTTQVASMLTPRHDHTATLLNDGRVLVVGGSNASQQWLSDSEVYDPATDSWTAIPTLATHGVQHTATRMNDGRVLVVGGADNAYLGTDRVEIFDPHTNSWWGAMPLSSDRASHTAQLLEDGRVLIAGGGGVLGYPEIGDALVYDPAANTWTATGPMIKPRLNAQSLRLADGRVLVVGGINLEDTVPGAPPLKMSNIAEIYDPQLNAWFATGNLVEARYGHIMVALPGGRVMVIGGARDYDCCWSESSFVREIEIWDPFSGDWTLSYQLPLAGANSAAVVLPDGRVWLSGGRMGEQGNNYLSEIWMITANQ